MLVTFAASNDTEWLAVGILVVVVLVAAGFLRISALLRGDSPPRPVSPRSIGWRRSTVPGLVALIAATTVTVAMARSAPAPTRASSVQQRLFDYFFVADARWVPIVLLATLSAFIAGLVCQKVLFGHYGVKLPGGISFDNLSEFAENDETFRQRLEDAHERIDAMKENADGSFGDLRGVNSEMAGQVLLLWEAIDKLQPAGAVGPNSAQESG